MVRLAGIEPILSKTAERNQTKETSPATARSARHITEKYSLLFSFCLPAGRHGARRISFSPNEKSIFLWCLALKSKVAGLASIFRKNTAEFPHTPLPPCSCGDGRKFCRRYFLSNSVGFCPFVNSSIPNSSWRNSSKPLKSSTLAISTALNPRFSITLSTRKKV